MPEQPDYIIMSDSVSVPVEHARDAALLAYVESRLHIGLLRQAHAAGRHVLRQRGIKWTVVDTQAEDNESRVRWWAPGDQLPARGYVTCSLAYDTEPACVLTTDQILTTEQILTRMEQATEHVVLVGGANDGTVLALPTGAGDVFRLPRAPSIVEYVAEPDGSDVSAMVELYRRGGLDDHGNRKYHFEGTESGGLRG